MKQKKNIILFMITMILSLIVLCFFVTGYYSIDTTRIYKQGYIDYATKDAYIRDGRLFSALIFVIVGLFNPEILTVYIINIIIAIIILSFCVMQIYHLIERYKKIEDTKNKMIAFMLSYTYIFNFLIVDILKFIDSFVIATSILLFIIAIKKVIIEKKNKLGMLLTILGVICYQGTIPVYIATAILITLLENKKINKEYFKKIVPCIISIIIASVLSVVVVNLVPVITDLDMTVRIEGIDYISRIEENLTSMSKILFEMFYMFPPYVWIGIVLFILAVSFIYGIKRKRIQLSIYILIIFMLYVASLFIIFPIEDILLHPRVALVLGETISAMLIYIYCTNFEKENMNLYEKIIVGLIIVYFMVTLVSIFKSTYEYKLGNEIDQEFSEKIENEIIELENQGIKINIISIKYTDHYDRKDSKLVFEQSTYLKGIYSLTLHEILTGRKLLGTQEFPEEIEETYFENPSEQEVQFKNIGEVLYVLVDL